MAKSVAPASASAIKPSALWRALAQATPKGAKALFVEHAEALAAAYTGAKQIKNELSSHAKAYGLNSIFKSVLKACDTESTPQAVFEVALLALLDKPAPKAKAEPKGIELVDVLGMLGKLSPEDLEILITEANQAKQAKQAEAPKATKATKATKAKQAEAPKAKAEAPKATKAKQAEAPKATA